MAPGIKIDADGGVGVVTINGKANFDGNLQMIRVMESHNCQRKHYPD